MIIVGAKLILLVKFAVLKPKSHLAFVSRAKQSFAFGGWGKFQNFRKY